ncbi:MAG: CCA tRNA nucleotidyltransferase [Lachnospiraceae bacterium]|nr:CCA tRNA nucleotidyltransferase [Lachnospiraceae bacterium]
MTITLPKDVSRIIKTLTDAGYEAYAVGGCVRDSILGRAPADWDITTSALPQDVKRLFKRTVDTGIQHGTVTVMFKMKGYEVTTYRIDGNYSDGRHPDSVTFASNLEEDLKRRDFTINAMAYNEGDGLVDIFGGVADLEGKIIRAVGKAEERFNEDALRIMRAFRFAAQLGFEIDRDTRAAAEKLAENLNKVSAERIRIELTKLAVSSHPELLGDMYRAGITRYFMPEFDTAMECPQNNIHHRFNVGEHSLEAMRSFTKTEALNDKEFEYIRLALLLHDLGKCKCKTTDADGVDHFHGHSRVSEEISRSILKRLKYDNETLKTVSALVLYHDIKPEPESASVRRAMNKMGADIFRLLFCVQKADIMGQSDYQRQEKLDRLARLHKVYEQVTEAGDPITVGDLAIKGNDLKELGVAPGPLMGEILRKLLEQVLEDPSCNTKQALKEKIKELNLIE